MLICYVEAVLIVLMGFGLMYLSGAWLGVLHDKEDWGYALRSFWMNWLRGFIIVGVIFIVVMVSIVISTAVTTLAHWLCGSPA